MHKWYLNPKKLICEYGFCRKCQSVKKSSGSEKWLENRTNATCVEVSAGIDLKLKNLVFCPCLHQIIIFHSHLTIVSSQGCEIMHS